MGLPHSSVGKESACNAQDMGLIPGSGRSPGEGNGSPLQYSCLENPIDRGAWWAIVHSVGKNKTKLDVCNKPNVLFFLCSLYEVFVSKKTKGSPPIFHCSVKLQTDKVENYQPTKVVNIVNVTSFESHLRI